MIKEQIRQRIRRRKGVIRRADFDDLGSYRSIGRALAALVDEGVLIKRGQGEYWRRGGSRNVESKPTVQQSLARQLRCSSRRVFLRRDFSGRASDETIRKALLGLQREGLLVRIGHGIYVRAQRSSFSGKILPEGGMTEIVREVAERLGREVIPDPQTQAYNAGLSTQVPTGRYVELSGPPMRRKLTFGRGTVKMVARGQARQRGCE